MNFFLSFYGQTGRKREQNSENRLILSVIKLCFWLTVLHATCLL